MKLNQFGEPMVVPIRIELPVWSCSKCLKATRRPVWEKPPKRCNNRTGCGRLLHWDGILLDYEKWLDGKMEWK